MATQLFERDEPALDRPEVDFRALEPPDLARLDAAFAGRLDPGEVRFEVDDRAVDVRVDDRFAAAAVRFDADFLAAVLRPVDPLDADFFAVDPPEPLEPLELDFFAVDRPEPLEPLELDFFAVDPPEVDFLAGELDFFAVEPPDPLDPPEVLERLELAFFAAVPPDVDFLAEEPPPEPDFFFAVDDPPRCRFNLPSRISPSQPSTSSWCSNAWFATNRRKCFSSRRTRRPWACQRLPVRSKRPCG
jgi:hypothetical protein